MKSIKTLQRQLYLLSQVAEGQTMAAIATAELRAMLMKELAIAESRTPRKSFQTGSVDFSTPGLRPLIDHSTFSVEWNGQRCHLGNRLLLKLLDRLCRRPGQFVSHEELLHEVWEARRCPETIRSAIRELRRRLREDKMTELAAAIQSQGKSYGLVLLSSR
jgi:DNA-binding response OmpR family regulator